MIWVTLKRRVFEVFSKTAKKTPFWTPFFTTFFAYFWHFCLFQGNSTCEMTIILAFEKYRWRFWTLKIALFFFEIQKSPFSSVSAKVKIVIFAVFSFFGKSQGLLPWKNDDFFIGHFLTRKKMTFFLEISIFTLYTRRNFLKFLKKVTFFRQKWDFFSTLFSLVLPLLVDFRP